MNGILNRFRNSTYIKVVSLLSVVSFCLLLLVAFLYFYMRVQEKAIFKNSKELYENEIHSLLKLNSESYSSVIADATYWDEFVKFTQSKDIKWFNTSIANIIDTYNVEYLAAYTADGAFITKVSTLKINTKNFIPKAVFKRIDEKKIDKFYLKIPEGIVEVYGASIHPSDDPFKNKSKPAGYFFMVRLLDREYFTNIEEICSSKIKFFTGKEQALKTVYTTIPLLDYNEKLISKLYFKRTYDIDFYVTKIILLIMAIAVVASWFIYYFYANKWSKIPLSLIKKILKKNDKSAIESLKNIKGEFRYMGKLFEENLNQKTELISAKLKAEEGEKLKTAFLMNLTHEIRTPMNAIVGFSDLLLDNKTSIEEKQDFVKIIQSNSKNLLNIVDDLLIMSKIDSNLIKVKLKEINFDATMYQIYENALLLNQNKNIVVQLNQPENSLQKNIITDEYLVTQIITKIIDNALKFTNEGYVFIDYEFDIKNAQLVIQIKDSGIGIPLIEQQNVFNRFSKLSVKNISANEGLGLGLTIANAFVKLLNGSISLKSEQDVGATFTIILPLQFAETNSLVEIIPNEKYVIGNEEIILVVEDDNINYMLIKKLLNIFNYQVLRAADGVEAVEICKNNDEIDLVFMDIKMPNLDGYGALEQIRNFNKDLPIIAHTSFSYPEEVEKIKSVGFNGFISKPLDKEVLYEIVKKYFNK